MAIYRLRLQNGEFEDITADTAAEALAAVELPPGVLAVAERKTKPWRVYVTEGDEDGIEVSADTVDEAKATVRATLDEGVRIRSIVCELEAE